MLFSKRNNYLPISKEFQIESIDSELKIRLWNLLKKYYWDQFNSRFQDLISHSNFDSLMNHYWHDFFKWIVDEMPLNFRKALQLLRAEYFNFSWHRTFDFIEFTIDHSLSIPYIDNFPQACNKILEEDNSAYRIVNNQFVQITDPIELNAIEQSIENNFVGVKTHIQTAVQLLSDRNNPDYRNSIKESISAVESMCQIITKDENATLGSALKKLDDSLNIHSALKSAYSKLYGYTSDKDGIRHSILEEPNLSFSDAKYMLVSCSAFINYLIGKYAENNMKL